MASEIVDPIDWPLPHTHYRQYPLRATCKCKLAVKFKSVVYGIDPAIFGTVFHIVAYAVNQGLTQTYAQVLGTKCMHELLIYYCHTEWNLLYLLFDNGVKFWKQSSVPLNFKLKLGF